MMIEPIFIPSSFIDRHHVYADLIPLLKQAFAEDTVNIPDRLHYDFGATERTVSSTLLIMPAWQNGQDLGIKLVTINPENERQGLPAIQGSYIFMDARTGATRAIIEGKALTRKRTAATSALAATYLAAPDAQCLLMIGTGAMAPELIRAHTSIRPITQVFIWGRHHDKAQNLAGSFAGESFAVQAVSDIREVMALADVISCATLSPEPLVFGKDMRPGQHLDLVGAYKPDMRESDNVVVRKARIFVDTYRGATQESGDLAIPLNKGIIQLKDIQAELSELCSGAHPGRQSADQITMFKSVGYALEDLVAARYYWNLWWDEES